MCEKRLVEMALLTVLTVVIGCLAGAEGVFTTSLTSLGLKFASVLSLNSDPCEGVDCPSYSLDSVGDGYVVRKYPAGDPGVLRVVAWRC